MVPAFRWKRMRQSPERRRNSGGWVPCSFLMSPKPSNSRIHMARILRLLEDLSARIEIVAQVDRIETMIPMPNRIVGEGLMPHETVHIIIGTHGNHGTTVG